MRVILFFSALVICLSTWAMAEVKISGKLISYDAKTIKLKETSGATVTVPRQAYSAQKLKTAVPGTTVIELYVPLHDMVMLNPKLGKK